MGSLLYPLPFAKDNFRVPKYHELRLVMALYCGILSLIFNVNLRSLHDADKSVIRGEFLT